VRRLPGTVGQRLTVLVLLSLAGFGALTMLAFRLVDEVKIGGSLYDQLQVHAQRRLDLALMTGKLSEIRADLVEAGNAKDRDVQRVLYKEVQEDSENLDGRLQALANQVTDAEEKAVIAAARATWQQFSETERVISRTFAAGMTPEATLLDMQRRREERFTEQVNDAVGVLTVRDREMERFVRGEIRRTSIVLALVAAGLGLGFGGLTFVVARSVMMPLRQLSRACDRAAGGDLTVRVNMERHDELGAVGRAFDGMMDEVVRSQALLRDAEARYGDIVLNAVEGIYQTSRDGTYLMANPALARIYGYDTPADLVDHLRAVNLYVDPAGRAEFIRRIDEDGVLTNFETQVRRKDGSVIWITHNARGVLDAGGRLAYYEGTVQDITERKHVEQLKSDFVSFATHQLRTPLSGIKWLLELAGDVAGVSDDARSYIDDARQSADRLVALVNDLLDASRLESGRVTGKAETMDLAALTRSIVAELAPLARDKSQAVSVSGDGDVALVLGDPQLIRQALINLASNAVKYTPAGGAIAIRMQNRDGEVAWSVDDTGIGIPAADQPRLFDKFFRAGNAFSVDTEGSGLGLYLVRLIVQQSGGRVWSESHEGQGSTFTLTLPTAMLVPA
jgi:PAS domain S-box-containing protein